MSAATRGHVAAAITAVGVAMLTGCAPTAYIRTEHPATTGHPGSAQVNPDGSISHHDDSSSFSPSPSDHVDDFLRSVRGAAESGGVLASADRDELLNAGWQVCVTREVATQDQPADIAIGNGSVLTPHDAQSLERAARAYLC